MMTEYFGIDFSPEKAKWSRAVWPSEPRCPGIVLVRALLLEARLRTRWPKVAYEVKATFKW